MTAFTCPECGLRTTIALLPPATPTRGTKNPDRRRKCPGCGVCILILGCPELTAKRAGDVIADAIWHDLLSRSVAGRAARAGNCIGTKVRKDWAAIAARIIEERWG